MPEDKIERLKRDFLGLNGIRKVRVANNLRHSSVCTFEVGLVTEPTDGFRASLDNFFEERTEIYGIKNLNFQVRVDFPNKIFDPPV